jgi:hydrogenase nickel incorporation protein HypA/HybF
MTKNILEIVLKHAELCQAQRVVQITLRIGELCDFVEEFVQRYFDYISKGTKAEGAKIKIIPVPIRIKCENCQEIFSVGLREMSQYACPWCGGSKGTLESGRELFIEEIEVM